MKRSNLKKLVLSAAIMSAGAFAYSANAENAVSGERDVQSAQSVTVPGPADRDITNPNAPGYVNNHDNHNRSINSDNSVNSNDSAINNGANDRSVTYSDVDAGRDMESATLAAEVDGTVHFEPNSVTLTEAAERQLKQVVDQLDKNAPVALTVELQGTISEGSTQSSSAALGQDSSAGLPMDERGLAGGGVSPAERSDTLPGNAATPSNNAEAVERETQERALLISRYRAENIRQYMERQGIAVVEWSMESNDASSAAGDTGFATSNPSAQQAAEEIQQVRIVVVGDVQPEGLSAL